MAAGGRAGLDGPDGPDGRALAVARLRAAGCVYAEEEADLVLAAATSADHREALLAARVAGAPLEHVLGEVRFAGMRLAVAPGVFVPRARTEVLLERALELARASGGGAVAVDLCCGCGAVAAGLLEGVGDGLAEVHAADLDPAAVAVARRNVEPRGGAVHAGDLYDALPVRLRGRVGVLVANAPHVPTGEVALMPREARLHEPALALDGGADGLDVHRRVVAGARAWLAPGGALLLEVGRPQADAAAALLRAAGLAPRVLVDDERGATTAVGAAPT